MKRLLTALTTLLIAGTLLPAPAFAFDLFPVCSDGGAGASAVCQGRSGGSTNPLTGSNGLLRGIAGIIALVTGVIAVVIVIIGGLRFVLAGGDPGKVKSARDTIVFAIVGLVVIVLADSIISLVISRL